MTTTPPKIPANARLNARQACDALGICFNTLKRRVREGKIIPRRGGDGRDYYTAQEIQRFWRER